MRKYSSLLGNIKKSFLLSNRRLETTYYKGIIITEIERSMTFDLLLIY